MKQFALISPVAGIKKDIPSLLIPDAFSTESENVIFDDGMVMKATGRKKEWAAGLGGSVRLIKHFKQSNGDTFLIAASKDKIYHLKVSDGSWTNITGDADFTSSDTDLWSCETVWDSVEKKEALILSNGLQRPYKWLGSGNISAVGTTDNKPPVSKQIVSFKNYLIAGAIYSSGELLPSTIQWCSIGEYENWKSGDSGAATLPGTDEIMGFAVLGDYCYVFKKNSIHALLYVGGSLVFRAAKVAAGIGCISPKSIVAIGNNIYFFGTNYKFYRFDGINTYEISKPIDSLTNAVNFNATSLLYGNVMERLNRIVWVYPATGESDNNKMFIYDMDYQGWSTMVIPGTCLCPGGYLLKEADVAWEDATGTWDEQTKKWNQVTLSEGDPINLIGDSSGYLYRLFATVTDDEDVLSGSFVTGKLHFKLPGIRKRLLQMRHYFKKETAAGTTVDISIKKDEDTSYQTVKNIALARETIVPAMTASALPVPYVASASSIYNDNPAAFAAWHAFDGTSEYFRPKTNSDEWVQIDLGSGNAAVVTGLRFYCGSTGLKNFILKGSNDGGSGTNIYTGLAIEIDEWQEFTFTNTTAYRYYRLYYVDTYAFGCLMRGIELFIASAVDEFVIFDHYCDYSAKTFTMKVSGSGRWRYLGTIFNFDPLGER